MFHCSTDDLLKISKPGFMALTLRTWSPGFSVLKMRANRPSAADVAVCAPSTCTLTPLNGVFAFFPLYCFTTHGCVACAMAVRAVMRIAKKEMRRCFMVDKVLRSPPLGAGKIF